MSNTKVGDMIQVTANQEALAGGGCHPSIKTGDVRKVLEVLSDGDVLVLPNGNGWLWSGMFKPYVEPHSSIVVSSIGGDEYGLLIEGGGFVVVFDRVVMHADTLVNITYQGNNAGGIHPPLLRVFLTKCAEIGINVIDDRGVK